MAIANIYRGSELVIQREINSLALAEGSTYYFSSDETSALYDWNAIYGLLAFLARSIKSSVVKPILRQHGLVLSSIAPEILAAHGLDPVDCSDIEAELSGHLTHNWYVFSPYKEAVVALLIDLLRQKKITLVIGDPALLDFPSRAILHHIARMYPDLDTDYIIGLIGDQAYAKPDDMSIRWRGGRKESIDLAVAFDMDESIIPVDLVACDHLAEAQSGLVPADSERGNNQCSMAHARHGQKTEHPLSLVMHELKAEVLHPKRLGQFLWTTALPLLERCFRSYGYRATLLLGLKILEYETRLDVSAASRVHAIVGLAAHNLQFTENGDERLEGFLIEHLTSALTAMNDDELEAAVCYRLAVTFNRRKKQFEQGHVWAERAVSVAGKIDGLSGQYQLAWARNIHAYSASKLPGNKAAAIHSIESSIELMSAIAQPSQLDARFSRTVWRNDILMSKCVMTVNRSTLCVYTGDNRGHMSWRTAIFPYLDHCNWKMMEYESRHWVGFYQHNLLPLKAMRWANAYQQAAIRNRDKKVQFGALAELARINYQLGFADKSARQFNEIYQLRNKWRERFSRTFHTFRGDAIRGQVVTVMPMIRGNMLAMADDILLREQQSLAIHGEKENVELLAALGLVAACGNDENAAEKYFNRAIELTNQLNSFSQLAYLVGMIGRANAALGKERETLSLYSKIISNAEEEETWPTMLFPLLVRYQYLTGVDQAMLDRAFALLVKAMDDVENWWCLADLLTVLNKARKINWASLDREGLMTFIWIAQQRVDCQYLLRPLLDRLPPQLCDEVFITMSGRYRDLQVDVPGTQAEQYEQRMITQFEGWLAYAASASSDKVDQSRNMMI